MRTITQPTYQCEYCNKIYRHKSRCASHEPICNSNPDNFRQCSDCAFLKVVKKEIEPGGDFGQVMDVKAYKCEKRGVYVYPPKVERSERGPYDFGDAENIPMPRLDQCSDYVEDLPF